MAIRGSGALFDACSSVLVFEAEKGQPTRISHEKARTSGKLCDDFELTVSDVEGDNGDPRAGLVVTASDAPDREGRAEQAKLDREAEQTEAIRSQIRELLESHGEQGGAASIAHKIRRSDTAVRRVLRIMVDEREVSASGKTVDRRHRLC